MVHRCSSSSSVLHAIGVAVFLLLGLLLTAVGTSAQTALSVPVYEDFEDTDAGSLPSGWSPYGSGTDTPFVVEAPAWVGAPSGSKVLYVGRTAGTATQTNRAVVAFEPGRERVVISFWFYTESTRRTLNVSIGGSETTGFVNRNSVIFLTIFHQDWMLQAYGPDGSWIDGPAVSPNRWHKVTVDIDVPSGTYDVYLDDASRPGIENAPFVNPSPDISVVAFNYQSAVADDNTIPVYIDDVSIRTDAARPVVRQTSRALPEEREVVVDLPEGVHPFLLVREEDYEKLRERSGVAPRNMMKAEAIQTARVGAPFGEAISAASLAYILDPDNRELYLNSLRQWLLEWHNIYDRVKGTRATQHSEMVAPSHDFFHSILALDIIYNDLTPEERREIIQGMDKMAGWFAQQGDSWALNKYAVIGTWALFRGDRETFLAAKQKYDHWLFERELTPGGVYVPGPGYAYFRLAKENVTKSFFMDILEFTGEGSYYDDPRLISFYEWVFGAALTPTRNLVSFGDTSPNGTANRSVVTAVKAKRFSDVAARNAAWAVIGAMPSTASMSRSERLSLLSLDPSGFNMSPPKGRLIDYLLIDELLASPSKPISRIWDAYAAFWEDNPSDQSLMGAMWNVTKSDGHSHKDINAVHIHGFGHPLLRNAGYPGWNQGWGNFPWTYFNSRAISNNVVLIAGADHQLKTGNGIVAGFTSPTFDYASGDSGGALPNGRHVRNFLFVHPQDGKAGYFVLFDEVEAYRPGDPVNMVLHPQSDSYEVVSDDEEYLWKIKYADDVYLTVHLGAEPTDVDIRDGALEMSANSFVGKYLYVTYDSDDTGDAYFSTVLFPHRGKTNRPAMVRLGGEGYHGTEIRWNESAVDVVVSADAGRLVSHGNVILQGRAALYRLEEGSLQFYFAREATRLLYPMAAERHGFESDRPVTLHLRGSEGRIISDGADVTFYGLGDAGEIHLNGEPAKVVDSGANWIKVRVPAGSFDIEIRHP